MMEMPKALLTFVLLTATASAASWEEDLSRCSTDCPSSGVPKLNYDLEKIYSYSYSVKSDMTVMNDHHRKAETEWSSTIEMTWISPCDMAIKFNNITINGIEGQVAAGSLEMYPLVVALTDGRVQHVCSHPDDDISSVNMKKGVASAIQNSLPSLHGVESPLTILETDVVGKCPTIYKTDAEEGKILVRKKKNHKECQKQFSTASPWMPNFSKLVYMNIQESNCQQEIVSGLYTTIVCWDKNILYSSYEDRMLIQAYHESRLQFQFETNSSSSDSPSNSQTEMVQDSLIYDQTVKKDPSLEAQLDETMRQICEKTMEYVEPDVASLVTKALQLMRLVPEVSVAQTLEKIRSGHFCANYRKLESLFLDIIAYLHDSSAVEVLVKELVSGAPTEYRDTVYAEALCFISQPNTYAIEALKPLMETSQSLSKATLCGATMVNAFCQNNHQCQEVEPVRSIASILSDKLEEQCSSFHDEETRTAALVTLKALGNMGVITPEISISVIRCMESQENDDGVRVAAVQAFRNAECGHIPTEWLTNLAMNSSVNTEVRITSYMAVIKCAGETELERIISGMIDEEDTQVRSFILSYLANLQRSSVPYKQPLKHLLNNMILPDESDVDITRRSRNVVMTFSAPPFGVKADIDSNILYTPESYIPRSLDANVTVDLLGTLINMVEAGTRFEGLEPFVEMIPNGRETSEEPRIDAFVRLLGQERDFASKPEGPEGFFIETIIYQFFLHLNNFQSSILNDVATARAAQYQEFYSFPTIQGTLFRYNSEQVVVVSLNETGFENLGQRRADSENMLKIHPGLSVEVTVFVGFDSHLVKEGLHCVSNITSNNNFTFNVSVINNNEVEIKIDVPSRMEVLNFGLDVFMIKNIIGLPEQTRSTQPRSHNPMIRPMCFRELEYLFGLQLCVGTTVYTDFPFGFDVDMVYEVYLEKTIPPVESYNLRISLNDMDSNGAGMKIQAKAVRGLSRQQELTLRASHSYEVGREMINLLFDTYDEEGGVWLSWQNTNGMATFESIVKFKYSYLDAKELCYKLKAELTERMRSPEDKEYELKVYFSRKDHYPPESQLLKGKLNMRSDGGETSLDYILNMTHSTRHSKLSLRGCLDLVETQYSHILVPSRMCKYEFLGQLGYLEVVSYLRKANVSSHEAFFAFNRHESEMVGVRVIQNAEGSWQQDNATFTTALTMNLGGGPAYEVFNKISYGNNCTGMTTEVLRLYDHVKMMEFAFCL